MKRRLSMVFLGLAAITLVTGCGSNGSEKTLTCTVSEEQGGMVQEQTIAMTFKNDKINRLTMDLDNRLTDKSLQDEWEQFTELMDSQKTETKEDGISMKVSKDDKNYSYKITLEVDLNKAKKDDLETYGLSELVGDDSTLEDVQKSAESDGYTCKVK